MLTFGRYVGKVGERGCEAWGRVLHESLGSKVLGMEAGRETRFRDKQGSREFLESRWIERGRQLDD
jgi:hypothetical protein